MGLLAVIAVVFIFTLIGQRFSRQRLIDATERLRGALDRAVKPLESGEPINTVVNAFICAGRYADARQMEHRFGDQSLDRSLVWLDPQFVLTQVNLAEADYNLGLWDEAKQRLLRFAPDSYPSIVRGGLLIQVAWILAHGGDGESALAFWNELRPGWCPRTFLAEHHFAHAAVLLSLNRQSEALAAVDVGASVAMRVSSARNALFMRARILAASGKRDEALSFFEQGAAHPYRGQGGDGLLAWGDCLESCGRRDAAREAWSLAIARDAESESAALARTRLSGFDTRTA